MGLLHGDLGLRAQSVLGYFDFQIARRGDVGHGVPRYRDFVRLGGGLRGFLGLRGCSDRHWGRRTRLGIPLFVFVLFVFSPLFTFVSVLVFVLVFFLLLVGFVRQRFFKQRRNQRGIRFEVVRHDRWWRCRLYLYRWRLFDFSRNRHRLYFRKRLR